MNRREFLENGDVRGFLDYFSFALTGWSVEYTSNNPRVARERRHFAAFGVEQALNQYAWLARFLAPENIEGFPTFIQGQICDPLQDWDSNRIALNYFRAGLRPAIRASSELALNWCQAILYWGLGANRWTRAYQHLLQIPEDHDSAGLCQYLRDVQQLIALDVVNTDAITAAAVPYASSGLAKIYCLASDDGLVILDSRVAGALGECINHYLREVAHQEAIPHVLKVPRDPGRTPTPVGPGTDGNHPPFKRDYRWIEAQVRVSWLLHAVLEASPRVFPNHDLGSRAHMLEAALFMMGAYTGQDHHHLP